MENKEKKQQSSRLQTTAKYTGIAAQMAIIMIVGVYGGMKLDEYLKLEFPVFTLIGSLGGAALAIYTIIKEFV